MRPISHAFAGVLFMFIATTSAADAAASKNFPPILVLTPSEAQALPLFADGQGAAPTASAACASLEAAWPERVSAVQAAVRAPSKAAFEAQAAELEKQLQADREACPSWAASVSVQSALLREHQGLYEPTHAADSAAKDPLPPQVPHSLAELRAQYIAINDAAWLHASHTVTRSWAAWRAQASCTEVPERKQRYLINLSTDDSLVASAPAIFDTHFTALVRVTVLPEVAHGLRVLQGQGPIEAADRTAYIDASVAEAQKLGMGAVVFVNAAEPQVPNFADAVGAHEAAAALPLHYVDLSGWQDGSVVTPKGAGGFGLRVAREVEAQGRPVLLVTNCNAGLDRSGTLNVLVQALLLARKERRESADEARVVAAAMARVPHIVVGLKEARPSSISSFGRYVFIYRALAAGLDLDSAEG